MYADDVSHCGRTLARPLTDQQWVVLKGVAQSFCIRTLGVPESDDPNFDHAAVAAWLFTRCAGSPAFCIPWAMVPDLYLFVKDSTDVCIKGKCPANRFASKLGGLYPDLFNCDWG